MITYFQYKARIRIENEKEQMRNNCNEEKSARLKQFVKTSTEILHTRTSKEKKGKKINFIPKKQ